MRAMDGMAETAEEVEALGGRSGAGASRNLVVCCDGTGNEVGGPPSNVLRLYQCLTRSDEQLTYYYPGIGTVPMPNDWALLSQRLGRFFRLATGAGLDADILRAYSFLCRSYRDGDRIFLFGFSRGAYTVRAVAGMIHTVGLLSADQVDVAPFVLKTYKYLRGDSGFDETRRIRLALRSRYVPIHFMGLWDTVNTTFVPRKERFFMPGADELLPYTRMNPSVRAFREALALDERRRLYRPAGWAEPQDFRPNPFGDTCEQDIKTVWFAGSHSDVGGGYDETESAPALLPFNWILQEATEHGLTIDVRRHGRMELLNAKLAERGSNLHESFGRWWRLLGAEQRRVPPAARIHGSVLKRMAADPRYRPPNLPSDKIAEG